MNRLAFVLIVLLGLAGCSGNDVSVAVNPPQIGGAVVVATVGNDGVDQVVTYNEALDLVCLENSTKNAVGEQTAARSNMAAFSCWETSSAPKKMQALVTQYLSSKK